MSTSTGINPTLVILSAEREVYGPEENTARSKQMAQLLKSAGLDFQEAVGVYGGRPEVSFVVYLPGPFLEILDQIKALYSLALHDFEQESILVVYPERTAQLYYQNGATEFLKGKFQEIDALSARKLTAYTFVNGYYYAVKE